MYRYANNWRKFSYTFKQTGWSYYQRMSQSTGLHVFVNSVLCTQHVATLVVMLCKKAVSRKIAVKYFTESELTTLLHQNLLCGAQQHTKLQHNTIVPEFSMLALLPKQKKNSQFSVLKYQYSYTSYRTSHIRRFIQKCVLLSHIKRTIELTRKKK